MPSFDRAIPPGGRGKIVLEVDSYGYNGQLVKSAAVKTNDPEFHLFTIFVGAQVEALFDMKPQIWFKLQTVPGKPVEETIELTSTRAEPFKVESVSHDFGPEVEAKLTTVTEGKVWKITLRTSAKSNEVSAGRVLVNLSGAPVKSIRIPAIVTVQPPEPPQK